MNIITFFKKIINAKEPEEEMTSIFDFSTSNIIDLNSKVNEYLDWYKKYLYYRDENISYEYPIMINFIEKMAVWYELAYPDELVKEIITNMYLNRDFSSKSLLSKQDFLSRLNEEEEFLLSKYKYPQIVYVDIKRYLTHFHLTEDGYINEVDDLADLDKSKVVIPIVNSFLDKHLTDIIPFFKRNEMIGINNELEQAVDNDKIETIRLEGLLDSVMYRIIERGGNRIGPYRAFLFALEFNRNIEIPIQYGYDPSDPHLREFVNEYFKAGGSKDITCYIDYFFRNDIDMTEEKLSYLFPSLTLNMSDKYTKEEQELHQKLINILKEKQSTKQKTLKLEKK